MGGKDLIGRGGYKVRTGDEEVDIGQVVFAGG